jgi:hypothetical protein
VFPAVLSLDK